MDVQIWVIGVAVAILVGVGLLLWRRNPSEDHRAAPSGRSVDGPAPLTETPTGEGEHPLPVVIGEDAAHPVLTIQASSDWAAYELAVDQDVGVSTISRLSALVQAVPGVAVAMTASGRRIMEVTVHGDLVRASDGVGLRAMVVGPNGIQEHARLFDPGKLTQLINVTAVWQIASVIVAQQHLAEISEKLDAIKDCVDRVAQFLEAQRRARVEATYDYLRQAVQAVRAGEFSEGIRAELESCERDLVEIQLHMLGEARRLVEAKIKHKEFVGTETLTADLASKMSKLSALGEELDLCLRTRIAACHVLALFPGSRTQVAARMQSINASIQDMASLPGYLDQGLLAEISGMESWMNRQSTIAERQDKLNAQRQGLYAELHRVNRTAKQVLEAVEGRLLDAGRPTRHLCAIEGGRVVSVRTIQ